MRAVFVAVAIVATAGPSLAQPSRQPSMIEEIVITSSTVDPSKLSNKERLARVCKAAAQDAPAVSARKGHCGHQHERLVFAPIVPADKIKLGQ